MTDAAAGGACSQSRFANICSEIRREIVTTLRQGPFVIAQAMTGRRPEFVSRNSTINQKAINQRDALGVVSCSADRPAGESKGRFTAVGLLT